MRIVLCIVLLCMAGCERVTNVTLICQPIEWQDSTGAVDSVTYTPADSADLCEMADKAR